MKRILRLIVAIGTLLAAPSMVVAQPSAHYVPGIEGIKGASLPPPGFYFRDYTVGYVSKRANDRHGDDAPPSNFRAYTFANVPRAVYITETKVLGGFVGVDALLPLIWQDVRAGGYKDDTFGIGDLFAEATLSWHLQRFDFSAGLGVWAPTGDSAEPPTTRVGAGYWTPMLTAGATWYIDDAKTWSLSALNRYEFNTEHRDTDITPGQVYTLEYGLGKAITKTIEVGAAGYYQEQVTEDDGRGSSDVRDRAAGIGPEVTVAFPEQTLFLSLRYAYEFMAEARAQGHTACLTVTKRF